MTEASYYSLWLVPEPVLVTGVQSSDWPGLEHRPAPELRSTLSPQGSATVEGGKWSGHSYRKSGNKSWVGKASACDGMEGWTAGAIQASNTEEAPKGRSTDQEGLTFSKAKKRMAENRK